MASTALAIAKPSALVAESPGFDFADMRIFTSVPAHDFYDVVALRGAVVVMDRSLIGREGILEGALYVRESQRPHACMQWGHWLRVELDQGEVHRRAGPVGPLKTRREVVQATRWLRDDGRPKDNWAVRLASGFVDGPYYDWSFGHDFIGKVVGIYRPS